MEKNDSCSPRSGIKFVVVVVLMIKKVQCFVGRRISKR